LLEGSPYMPALWPDTRRWVSHQERARSHSHIQESQGTLKWGRLFPDARPPTTWDPNWQTKTTNTRLHRAFRGRILYQNPGYGWRCGSRAEFKPQYIKKDPGQWKKAIANMTTINGWKV
jgi:hypothetical protein